VSSATRRATPGRRRASARQAGGTLAVRSRRGGGTTLTLELPSAPRARSAGGGRGEPVPASPERVADDLGVVPG
jgi:hypothetical protein